jgi:hypothetical protein
MLQVPILPHCGFISSSNLKLNLLFLTQKLKTRSKTLQPHIPAPANTHIAEKFQFSSR